MTDCDQGYLPPFPRYSALKSKKIAVFNRPSHPTLTLHLEGISFESWRRISQPNSLGTVLGTELLDNENRVILASAVLSQYMRNTETDDCMTTAERCSANFPYGDHKSLRDALSFGICDVS